MQRRALVLALMAFLLLGGCGASPAASPGGTGGGASPAPTSTIPIDTVEDDGVGTAEIGRSAGAAVAGKGGAIAATGSDGLTYELTIPEGAALRATEVTITPVRELRALEGSPPVLAAVRLEPAGSVFATPLDLAIPFRATPAAGAIPYAVLSSDGGTTWDAFPARVENGVAHIEVYHFSHIALVLGGFSGDDLSYLDETTGVTDESRRRIAREAVARSAPEAIPAIRPILRDWLLNLRDRARVQADAPVASVDAALLLRIVSDRVSLYRSITTTLETFLSSGELDPLLSEPEFAELLGSVDLYLGTAIEHAIQRATAECIAEPNPTTRLQIAAEQFGWYAAGYELRSRFGFAYNGTFLTDFSALSRAACPRLDLQLLELRPEAVKAGDRPRVAGFVRLFVGDREVSPGEFANGAYVDLDLQLRGFDDPAGNLTARTDGTGQVDVQLPASSGDRVEVSVLACLVSDAARSVPPCETFDLSGGATGAPDLRGDWAGELTGGNVAEPAEAVFQLRPSGTQSDGSEAFEGPGQLRNVTLTSFPIRLPLPFDARLEVRVYPDGRARGTMVYEVVEQGLSVNCEGTLVGDATLPDAADQLTFVFGAGSECLQGSDLTLHIAKR